MSALQSPAYSDVITGYWHEILEYGQPETIERVMADLAGMDQAVMVNYFAAVLAYRPVPDLQQFNGPIHIIHAPVTDVPNGLHQLFPNIPATKIESASHWLQLDKPADFQAAFDQALSH